MAHKYDIDYSVSVGTDYPEHLKSFVNAKLKVFFVPSVKYGREIVELIQRTNLEFHTVTYDRAWDLNKWGIGDFYDIRAAIDDFRTIHENLENALESDEHFDVMVIPGVNGWAHFSSKTRQAILRRVEDGAGLVLIKPFHGGGMEKSQELELLSPLTNQFEEGFGVDANAGRGFPIVAFDDLKQAKWIPEEHYITDGIPFELFPFEEVAYYPYGVTGKTIIRSESGDPISAVKEYGKGRIVAFGYYPRDILPQHSQYTGHESTYDAIIDGWSGAQQSVSFPYLEYFYEMIYRSIIWVSRRTPTHRIASAAVHNHTVIVEKTTEAESQVRYTIKDLYDNSIEGDTASTASVVLPERLKLGGTYRVELALMDGDLMFDWATVAVTYPRSAQLAELSPIPQEIKVGDEISTTFQICGCTCECRITVIDDFAQILHEGIFLVDGNGSLPFRYRADNVQSLHIRIRGEVYVQGHLVQRVDSEPIVVTPQQRGLDDFEVFMCPQNRGRGDWLPLVGKLAREIGVTGLFPGSPKTLTMSGASGLGVYWYHRHPYVQRKEQYLRTKDKSFLLRVPCLNDPGFWAEMQSRITSTIMKHREYGPVSYFANDEGSLTCYVDELDLCFCPHCMNAMREWAMVEYGNLVQLNRSWGTAFTSWEEVIPYTLEEAQRAGQYASWGDHRRFMEWTFSEAYRKIRSFIQEVDEHGIIRMSGCQASTAYSGYDYYQLHRHVRYFEAYSVGNQFEFHRSFAYPGTIIGGWFGYGADGVSVQNNIWKALYHNMTLISLFWEYSCINPDFTFSRSAMDMSKAFIEIKREGIGKLLLYGSKRDSLGIAIHYSMPSVHGTRIKEQNTRFELNRQGWVDVLEDLGYQYNFVASQQIETGELDHYKLLILPYSIALSEREASEIKRFAANGGVVVGDLQTGIMDEHCRVFETGKLDDLFGILRLTTQSSPFYINRGFKTNKNFPYFRFNLSHIPGREDEESGLTMAEIGIRENDGIAAYHDDFMGTVASVVTKEYGKGKGVYLNLSLDQYPLLRSQGGGFSLRELLKHILTLSDIVKPATLKYETGTPVELGYETIYYQDNEAVYVCVQRQVEDGTLGHDGLVLSKLDQSSGRVEKLTVEFYKTGHVYDIRAKSYLGFTNRAETEIEFGGTKIFAILPYRVHNITIDMPIRVRRGETVEPMIHIGSEKPESAYNYVVSINVYDPSGQHVWLYSENRIVSGNMLGLKLPIPFNEQTGQWKICVKDVATGVTSEALFDVV